MRPLRWLEDAAADSRFALRSLRRTPALGGRRGHHARARHRRQRRDLLGGQRRRAAAAAVPGARSVGDDHRGESGEALASSRSPRRRTCSIGAPASPPSRTSPAYADFLGTVTLTGRGDPQTIQARRTSPGNFFSTSACAPALGRTFADDGDVDDRHARRRAERPRVARHASAPTRRSSERRSSSTARRSGRRRDAAGLRVPVRERRRVAVDRVGSASARRRRASAARTGCARSRDSSRARRSRTADAQLQTRRRPAQARVSGDEQVHGRRDHAAARLSRRRHAACRCSSCSRRSRFCCSSPARTSATCCSCRPRAASAKRRCVSRSAPGARVSCDKRSPRASMLSVARRSVRAAARMGGHARARATAAGGHAPRSRLRRRRDRSRVRPRHHDCERTALRRRAGALDAPPRSGGSLKDGGRGAAQGARAKRWGELLVVGEVAFALLMTVGAGLLVRSFWQVRHVDPASTRTACSRRRSVSTGRTTRCTKVRRVHAPARDAVARDSGRHERRARDEHPVHRDRRTRPTSSPTDRPPIGYGTEVGHRTRHRQTTSRR